MFKKILCHVFAKSVKNTDLTINSILIIFIQTLTASSDVDETQTWLAYHRFHNYQSCFANFTGADLLRMSRSDLIQLCGPADGIRLNNALQARWVG